MSEHVTPTRLHAIADGATTTTSERDHLSTCTTCAAALEDLRLDNDFLSSYVPGTGPLHVPGYEIGAEIHRGTQGVVFRAEQASTRRTVAIKVMLAGSFATLRQRTRFEREIELAASLDHPNIVTVHEAGEATNGSAYVVMELVEGVRLDDFARDRPIDDVVEVVARLASAVAFAHGHGVIHRDLKPANVLVDIEGEPHVLDFGIACLTDRHDEKQTREGEFLGTLRYASPEQLGGETVDTRSDVYAIGVMLYEALTGAPPHEGQDIGAFIDEVRRDAPVPPSTRRPEIDRDLETIILRALAKEKASRYESAGALSSDLRRWRRGEAIEARRDDRLYVLRKVAWRHRWLVGVASIFGAMTIAYGVTVSVLYVKRMIAERERDQRAAQVIDMLNSFVRTLATADTEMSMTNIADVRAFLDEASANVDALLLDHPELASKLHTSLSIAFLGRADFEAAEREIRKALDIEERTPTAPGARRDIEQALGRVLWKQGRFAEAEACYRRALDLEATKGERARTHHHLAATLQQLMRFEEAEVHWKEALRLRHEVLAPDDPEILNSRNGLAVWRHLQGDPEGALPELEEVLRKIRAYGVEHDFRVARVEQNLARCLVDLGRLDEAESLLTEAAHIIESFFDGDSLELAPVEHALARIAVERGERTDLARRARDRRRALLGQSHHETLESEVLVALEEGDIESMRIALEALARALPEGHWTVALAIENLGILQRDAGDDEAARRSFERALHDLRLWRPNGERDIARLTSRLAASP